MSTQFSLGQRVKITNHIERRSVNGGTHGNNRVWEELPFTVDPLEGIIIGERTLSNGRHDYGWEDDPGIYMGKEFFTAYLVATSLRRKPLHVLPKHIQFMPEPTPEWITVPAPNVPYPGGSTQAHFMRTAARNVTGRYPVGGSNVTAAVVKLLKDAANALDAA